MERLFMTDVYGNVSGLSLTGFTLSVFTAFILGALLANLYYATSNSVTKGFTISLAILPPVTCVVLLLISKNFGAGLAVAGIFALVRFKSVAGSAKEIATTFISAGIGILCGTGYLMLSIPFSIIIIIAFFAYSKMDIWKTKRETHCIRMLSIDTAKKEGSRAETEAFLDQFVIARTLVSVENKMSKETAKKVKAGKDKTDKEKSEKDKSERINETADNMILRYDYRITLEDEAAEDVLLEALVKANCNFTLEQVIDRTKERF